MHPIATFLVLLLIFGAVFGGVLFAWAEASFRAEYRRDVTPRLAREDKARAMYAMRIRDTIPTVRDVPSLPTANYRKA